MLGEPIINTPVHGSRGSRNTRKNLGTLILVADSEQSHFQFGPCNKLMEELKENVSVWGEKLFASISTYLFCLENTIGSSFPFHAKLIEYNLQ